MAVTVTLQDDDLERGHYYEIDLSANGDVAQAWLRAPQAPPGLSWQLGEVGWHKTADVTVTFTNAGGDAMAVAGGNGVLAGWVSHPDDANTEASETLPITGLRFTAGAAAQKVLLYTGKPLRTAPVDAGTPA